MHVRWCLEGAASRTAGPASVFRLEFHLLLGPLGQLAGVSGPDVLVDQMLR